MQHTTPYPIVFKTENMKHKYHGIIQKTNPNMY